MKKMLLGLIFVMGCAGVTPTPVIGVLTIEAQTLPIIKTITWDIPVSDATHGTPTSYVVRLDDVVVGTPIGLTQSVTFTTLGRHTISVVSVNEWAMSPPALLLVNVLPPNPVTNVRTQ